MNGRLGDVVKADGTVIPQDLRLGQFPIIGASGIKGKVGEDVQPLPTRPLDDSLPPVIRHPFEVYVKGFTSSAHTTATVEVAWGTVLEDSRDQESVATIADFDDDFTLSEGDSCGLHVEFGADGSISSITLEHGEAGSDWWTSYPDPVVDNSPTGNEWFHLLAHVIAPKTGKLGGGVPDSGQVCVFDQPAVIQQDTHTHLAVVKKCIGLTRESFWVLEPWIGAHT